MSHYHKSQALIKRKEAKGRQQYTAYGDYSLIFKTSDGYNSSLTKVSLQRIQKTVEQLDIITAQISGRGTHTTFIKGRWFGDYANLFNK